MSAGGLTMFVEPPAKAITLEAKIAVAVKTAKIVFFHD